MLLNIRCISFRKGSPRPERREPREWPDGPAPEPRFLRYGGFLMSTARRFAEEPQVHHPDVRVSVANAGPAYQAYRILQAGFVAAPVLAGLDKFFHLLVDWDRYLPGIANRMVGGHGHELMLAVGVIEIAAGIGVALKPRVFS